MTRLFVFVLLLLISTSFKPTFSCGLRLSWSGRGNTYCKDRSCELKGNQAERLLTTTKLPKCNFFWIMYYKNFTHSSHTFLLMFQNLCNGNCETVGPEGGGKLGGSHVPWTFHAPSHSVAYCRDCNKSEKGSLKFKFTIFGGPALPQNFMSHRIVFSFAWLVEIWEFV